MPKEMPLRVVFEEPSGEYHIMVGEYRVIGVRRFTMSFEPRETNDPWMRKYLPLEPKCNISLDAACEYGGPSGRYKWWGNLKHRIEDWLYAEQPEED